MGYYSRYTGAEVDALLGEISRIKNYRAGPGLTINKDNKLTIDIGDGLEFGTTEEEKNKVKVNFSRIPANTIVESHISKGAITTDKIYSRAVTGEKIALATITEEHIVNDAVTTTKIFSRAVTSKKIAEQAIIAEHIAPNTITEEHLSQELRDKINDDAGYVWTFKENETVAQVATTATQTQTTVYTRI